MVTKPKKVYMGRNRYYIEGNALSTDELPTEGIYNGSKMEVLDTTAHSLTIKVFDEAGSQWVPVATVSAEG